MRTAPDPRPSLDALRSKSQLLLIEIAQKSFAERGIVSELEGL